MKNINSLNIDGTDLAATASSRQYVVNGEIGAKFILQVFNSSQQFYDFATRSFSATFTSTSSLQVEMDSFSFSNSISFPANGSGDTYTILLLTPPDKDTTLNFGAGKSSYSITITQLATSTLTFTPSTASGDSYQTFSSTGAASVESEVPPMSTTSITKAVDWTLKNTKNDSNGYGLRLIRQPIDTDWYFTTTETVNQPVDTGSTTEVVVDDLTDLCTGMYITAGTGLSGTPTVTTIDTTTKTLTLSTAQNFADGATLTFQARGGSVIKKAIGIDLDFSNWNSDVNTVSLTSPFTKKIRATGSNAIIALDNTYGITGGGHITIKGLNVVNTSANAIQSVTTAAADGTGGDGRITVQVNQTTALSVGTVIRLSGSGIAKGSRETLDIDNEITINSHPSSNREIFLNLDNFITPGVSGL